MERLTKDLLQTNTEFLLNYAYAEDSRVHLGYAGDQEDKDLCEYVSEIAKELKGCDLSPQDVMDGGCLECDCPVGILYTAAVQAAELHARLHEIEDILGDTYDLARLREMVGEASAVKHGRWITRHSGLTENWVDCSECGTVGSPHWKRCPVCEAKMDLQDVTDINVGNKPVTNRNGLEGGSENGEV